MARAALNGMEAAGYHWRRYDGSLIEGWGAMWTYLIGPALALLPERWRTARFGELGVDWPRAAAVSALIEGFGALALLAVWYSIFVTKFGGAIAERGGNGFVGLFLVALHPLTWVICYFGCEGAVRFLAAVATGESYGTLPLALIAWGVERAHQRRQGRIVADEVMIRTTGHDLQVASCRAKEHWKYPLTICYQGEFYQVVSEEVLPQRLHPYIYFLRRLPANETIKGLERYDPARAFEDESPGLVGAVTDAFKRPRAK